MTRRVQFAPASRVSLKLPPPQKMASQLSLSLSSTSKEKSVDIPKCSPHLMPFHIAYTGPAPVNTYFRPVRSKREDDIEFPKDEKTLPQNLSSDSQSTLVASCILVMTLCNFCHTVLQFPAFFVLVNLWRSVPQNDDLLQLELRSTKRTH